jgi:cytochrome d ubiquinol oxidase subunit I
MESLSNPILLSRLQFATTTLFHIVWPVLTIGLSAFLVLVEAVWLKTGDIDHYRHARFWGKLFLLTFAVGVVTGLPLEFQFGTNWAAFSVATGDYFGNILGFEGSMAFMLEAGFLGIMMFGWQRVAPGIHLFATSMVALGASISAFWILAANSWMQTPAGGHMEGGRFVIDSYADAIFNPAMPWGVAHMWVACIETSLFVLGGLSAWYIYRNRHPEFFLKSFRLALAGALVAAPLQIVLSDGSGLTVFEHQPAKGAAIEGHWQTNPPGQGASWAVLAWPDARLERNDWAIEIPYVLSLLATHDPTGQVKGLQAFPPDQRPPALPLLFYSFRVMVAIGFYFLFLAAWTGWVRIKGGKGDGLRIDALCKRRWLLRAWIAAIPLGYIAVEAGWIVREVGRQPWIVYGLMRTEEGASELSAATVGTSLAAYIVVYAVLLTAYLVFAYRLLRHGPDLEIAPPERHPGNVLDTRPARISERRRDVESG